MGIAKLIKEFAEHTYFKKYRGNTSSLIPINHFWCDYATHLTCSSGTPFLSKNFIYATSTTADMICALAGMQPNS